jgi:hypothetical protein
MEAIDLFFPADVPAKKRYAPLEKRLSGRLHHRVSLAEKRYRQRRRLQNQFANQLHGTVKNWASQTGIIAPEIAN